VFPAAGYSVDPRSGAVRRHHVDEKRIQRAVKSAALGAGIVKQVSPHTLRHYLPFRTMSGKSHTRS
jgi:integrase